MGERPDRQVAKVNIAALARAHGPKAIEKVAKLLEHADPRIVLDAARSLLDRGYGKPTQTIERSGNEPDKMTDAELIAAIRAAALDGVDAPGGDTELVH